MEMESDNDDEWIDKHQQITFSNSKSQKNMY